MPARPSPSRSSGLIRGFARVSLLCILVYVGVVVVFASLQRSMIYVARKGAVSIKDSFVPLHNAEEVTVPTQDGLTLHGWLSKSYQDNPDHRLVILFPGNAGNRAYRAAIMDDFNSCGCDCLIFDYRGYAENPGSPSEAAFASDAQSIWNEAIGRLGYRPDRIVLCGESLGGGVATRLAWEKCREGTPPAGLILRTTFTSLADVASRFYRWLPVKTLLIDRYPSIERVPEITCPIFVIHGRLDEIVPFSQGEELFRAAPATSRSGVPKSFLELPETGHNDVQTTSAGAVHEGHLRFLKQAFASETAGAGE